MSAYTVNKLCHRLFHDAAFRAAMKRDPATATADWPLTDAERKALLTGDVVPLYESGAHPFLLAHLARFELVGLTYPIYNDRMRGAREPD
jgi:hypothetical protein